MKDEKRIHMIVWSKLCYPKQEGGLGFRDMESFNRTLVAKQGWRILSHRDSLLACVLKGKSFPSSSFLQASQGRKASLDWQSIIWGREIIKKGVRWHTGNGESIFCKEDRWVPYLFPQSPRVKQDRQPHITRVCQVIDHSRHSRNLPVLEENFALTRGLRSSLQAREHVYFPTYPYCTSSSLDPSSHASY